MAILNKYVTEFLGLDDYNVPYVIKTTTVKLFKHITLYFREDSTMNKNRVSEFRREDCGVQIGFKQAKKKKNESKSKKSNRKQQSSSHHE